MYKGDCTNLPQSLLLLFIKLHFRHNMLSYFLYFLLHRQIQFCTKQDQNSYMSQHTLILTNAHSKTTQLELPHKRIWVFSIKSSGSYVKIATIHVLVYTWEILQQLCRCCWMRCQSLALSYVTQVQGFVPWASRCQGAWYHWSPVRNTFHWSETWQNDAHWMVLGVCEVMKSARRSPHPPLQMSVSELEEKIRLKNFQIGIQCVTFLDLSSVVNTCIANHQILEKDLRFEIQIM